MVIICSFAELTFKAKNNRNGDTGNQTAANNGGTH